VSIRVGVIGVGYLGQHHARIFSEIEGTELTAVVDIDRGKADFFAEKYGCAAHNDYREILHAVDAVSVVTPTTLHHSIALECLRAGKDVLVEKPITVSVDEADDLIMEADKRGCIVQVGHLERYNPAVLYASDMIREPLFVESERLSPFLGRGLDVDVTLDLMIHDVDIILSLVALPVREIKAVGARVLTKKIDVAKAWIEFEKGCTALVTVSRLSPEKLRRLKVFQRDSYILVDYQNSEVKRYFRNQEGIASETTKPEKCEPLKEELKDFVRCVHERKKPKVSAREGRDALKVVTEITEKIRNSNEEMEDGSNG